MLCQDQTGRKDYEKWEIIDAIPPEEGISLMRSKIEMIKVLRSFSDISIHGSFGRPAGTGNDDPQARRRRFEPKKKRYRLKPFPQDRYGKRQARVMEQDQHFDISDEEKVNLQQYITRIYVADFLQHPF